MGRTGRAYRRVRSKFTDRPTYFSWVIEGRLAASGLPSSEGQLEWLKRHGVSTILTLTETPLPKEWLEGTGLTVSHVPMSDHAPPSQEALDEAVRFMSSQLDEGKTVLVHCLAGVGRTGSVLAAYFMQRDGKTAEQALLFLRGIRPRSVEAPQEPAIREYERRIMRAK